MAGVDASAMWELVSSLQGLNGDGSSGSTEQATCTRVDNDGTVWVRLLGAETDTPVNGQRLADVVVGDNVTVTIEDGLLSVIGNSSRPSTSASHVEEVVGPVVQRVTEVVSVVADKASVGELQAATARIGELEADHVAVDDLTAVTGRIQSLESDHVSVADFQAEQANIDTLQANTADIDTIRANSAKVQNLTAAQLEADHATVGSLSTTYATIGNLNAANGRIDTLESTKANISDLEANYITADEIEATYMHANMSNSDVAWIENGTIKNGAIVSAMINDVSANKLTAGTINGSVINVTNLNADNITTGTINGQRIGEGSLSLSKLEDDVYTETEVNNIVDGLNDRIDGAIETFTGTAVPTLSNSPASSWNTTKLRDEHVGDVYYVVNSQSQQNGYCYRFTKSGSTYSWQLIKDSDVTAALQRISAAEGKITTFDSDISTLKTDTGTLTTRTTNLETRADDVDEALLDKVDVTTFNEVSDTVDAHTQTISQHTTAISNKADSSTVTAVTNRVSKNEQDISGINTTISELQETVETKADGSTVSTISNKLNTVSDTVDGHTQAISSVQNTLSTKADSSTVSTLTTKVNTVSDTVDGHTQRLSSVEDTLETKADGSTVSTISTKVNNISDTVDGHTSQLQSVTSTQTSMQSTLDKTVKSSIQLWYSKANTTAPSKPTSQVTSTSTSGGAWRTVVPSYNASYPNYYYCWQYEYVDGTYGWSAVVRDIAMGESQATARTADSNASAAVTTANTASTNASTALTTANTASTNASEAKTAATTASTTASEAKTTAETAASDASTAKSNAASAVTTANSASTTATNAQNTANANIKSSVQLWFTKANGTAPSKPTSVVSTSNANTANAWNLVVPVWNSSYPHYFYCYQQQKGDGTYQWTDVVYDRATSEAQQLANTTSTNLSTLQTNYATFKQTTEQFESTVGSRLTTIESDIDGVEERVSDNETSISNNASAIALKANSSDVYTKSAVDGKITQEVTDRNAAITAKANEITSTVSQTYTTKQEFADLEVGGRNLIRNTGTYDGWIGTDSPMVSIVDDESGTYARISPTSIGWYNIYGMPHRPIDLLHGRTVTISCDVRGHQMTSSSPSVYLNIQAYNTSNRQGRIATIDITFATSLLVDDQWVRIYRTLTFHDDARTDFQQMASGYTYEDIAFFDVAIYNHADFPIDFRHLKVEYGNRPMDWSPAPEDTDERVEKAESAITQNATNINAKVSKNDVINQINLSTEGVLIDADRVEINGTAVFNAIKSSTDAAYDAKGAAATVQTNLDNIEVGGRNLLHGTANPIKSSTFGYDTWTVSSGGNGVGTIETVSDSPVAGVTKSFRITGNSSGNRDFGQYNKTIQQDLTGTYRFTAWVRGIGGSVNAFVRVWDSTSGKQTFSEFITATTSWTKVDIDFDPDLANSPSVGNELSVRIGMTGSGSVEWIAPKLEKGNKATDWSPAPEDIVSRTQRIYYRWNSATAPATPTTWVTKGDDGSALWTKMHVSITSTHKYIYTCEQYEMADGTLGHTDVLLDNTITVIDGGNIITDSITANKLNASDINASKTLTVGAMTDAAAATILNSNVDVGGRNLALDSKLITHNATAAAPYVGIRTTAPKVTRSDGFVAIAPKQGGNWAGPAVYVDSLGLKVGDLVAFSCLYEYQGCSANLHFYAMSANSSGSRVYVNFPLRGSNGYGGTYHSVTQLTNASATNPSGKIWVVAEWSQAAQDLLDSGGHVCFTFQVSATTEVTSGGSVHLYATKLERGNKPTDWSPAPEDVDAAVSDAAQTATNYIVADSSGIKIADASPSSATTYLQLASTFLDFIRGGVSMLKAWVDGTTAKVRLGCEAAAHIVIDSGSIGMLNGENEIFSLVGSETVHEDTSSTTTSDVSTMSVGNGEYGKASLSFERYHYESEVQDSYRNDIELGVDTDNDNINNTYFRLTDVIDTDSSSGTPQGSAKLKANYLTLENDSTDAFYTMQNVMDVLGGGVTLYDNANASASAAATLSESAANFKRLTIMYRDQDNTYGSVDVWNPNGKRVSLDLTWINGASTQQMYQRVRWVTISGTTISTAKDSGDSKYRTGQVRLGGSYSVTNSDYISIVHVIGYR